MYWEAVFLKFQGKGKPKQKDLVKSLFCLSNNNKLQIKIICVQDSACYLLIPSDRISSAHL